MADYVVSVLTQARLDGDVNHVKVRPLGLQLRGLTTLPIRWTTR